MMICAAPAQAQLPNEGDVGTASGILCLTEASARSVGDTLTSGSPSLQVLAECGAVTTLVHINKQLKTWGYHDLVFVLYRVDAQSQSGAVYTAYLIVGDRTV